MFSLDPVAVLDEESQIRWSVRVAAYNVINADKKAAADHQKQHSRVTPSRRRGR